MDLLLGGEGVMADEGALAAWPVGSIFMSVTPTSPAISLGGGTWQRWGVGRVPVSLDTSQEEFNVVEKTGGEKKHTLTAAELPPHTHSVAAHTHNIPVQYAEDTDTSGTGSDNTKYRVTDVNGAGLGGGSAATGITNNGGGGSTGSVGSGTPHNVMQPYITCYMWKRVE
jgi:microcystin-dependent protein